MASLQIVPITHGGQNIIRGYPDSARVVQPVCGGGVLGVQRWGRGMGAGLPPYAVASPAEEGEAQDEGTLRLCFDASNLPIDWLQSFIQASQADLNVCIHVECTSTVPSVKHNPGLSTYLCFQKMLITILISSSFHHRWYLNPIHVSKVHAFNAQFDMC